jgi:ATP-dependent Clp protease protease subunit
MKLLLALSFLSASSSYLRTSTAFVMTVPLTRGGFLKNAVIGTGSVLLASSSEAAGASDREYAGVVSQLLNQVVFATDVNQQSCLELRTALKAASDESVSIAKQMGMLQPPPVKLFVQSNGGSVLDTLYLCDMIESNEVPVHTIVLGYAASCGSILAVCGDKRYMTRKSVMLIHQLRNTLGFKKKAELDDEMKNMEVFTELIEQIYLDHSKMDILTLRELLGTDRWLTAQQCLDFGLIDGII